MSAVEHRVVLLANELVPVGLDILRLEIRLGDLLVHGLDEIARRVDHQLL